MLQNYSDGIKDLKHLLDVEPKNGPAKKEMELMKNYWREVIFSLFEPFPEQALVYYYTAKKFLVI